MQYLIAFCGRLETVSDVISGRYIMPIDPNKFFIWWSSFKAFSGYSSRSLCDGRTTTNDAGRRRSSPKEDRLNSVFGPPSPQKSEKGGRDGICATPCRVRVRVEANINKSISAKILYCLPYASCAFSYSIIIGLMQ